MESIGEKSEKKWRVEFDGESGGKKVEAKTSCQLKTFKDLEQE